MTNDKLQPFRFPAVPARGPPHFTVAGSVLIVSVTQHFNTTSSMGRLTLDIENDATLPRVGAIV
jgi:hypothetical protein